MKSMAARDIVRGAEGHVNGELLKELRIDAGEGEDTDEMSSSFKARLHTRNMVYKKHREIQYSYVSKIDIKIQ